MHNFFTISGLLKMFSSQNLKVKHLALGEESKDVKGIVLY